jgi:exosortase K
VISDRDIAVRTGLHRARATLQEHRWRIAAIVVALAVVVAGKQFYRDASPADLRWILAPTAQLVSWVTGHDFVYESGQGWINIDIMFVIAPACAGVNFALAALLALVLGSLANMTDWRSTLTRLARALVLAYTATLVVNTVRIAIAVHVQRTDLHRLEGVIVYLGGLIGLYALARVLDGRKLRAFHWFGIPLAAYLLITLVMPLANGAARRADFVRHATVVLAVCFVVVAIASFCELVRWNQRRNQ